MYIPMLAGMLMRQLHFYYTEVHKLSIVSFFFALPLNLKAFLMGMKARDLEARR